MSPTENVCFLYIDGPLLTTRSDELCPDIGGRVWLKDGVAFPFLSRWLTSNLEDFNKFTVSIAAS